MFNQSYYFLFAGAVVSNNTIYLEPNTVSPGSESSEEGNFVAGEPSVGELCVHGDNLTLGYVRIGDSDRFIRCQISGKEGEVQLNLLL